MMGREQLGVSDWGRQLVPCDVYVGIEVVFWMGAVIIVYGWDCVVFGCAILGVFELYCSEG